MLDLPHRRCNQPSFMEFDTGARDYGQHDPNSPSLLDSLPPLSTSNSSPLMTPASELMFPITPLSSREADPFVADVSSRLVAPDLETGNSRRPSRASPYFPSLDFATMQMHDTRFSINIGGLTGQEKRTAPDAGLDHHTTKLSLPEEEGPRIVTSSNACDGLCLPSDQFECPIPIAVRCQLRIRVLDG
jgi:hypothetical protein